MVDRKDFEGAQDTLSETLEDSGRADLVPLRAAPELLVKTVLELLEGTGSGYLEGTGPELLEESEWAY